MILRMIKYNEQIEKDRVPDPADQIMIESSKIMITCGINNQGNLNCINLINESKVGENELCSGKPVWEVIHKGEVFLFTDAYLMNNDGKTIERYG